VIVGSLMSEAPTHNGPSTCLSRSPAANLPFHSIQMILAAPGVSYGAGAVSATTTGTAGPSARLEIEESAGDQEHRTHGRR
jgi:hypothetical protein